MKYTFILTGVLSSGSRAVSYVKLVVNPQMEMQNRAQSIRRARVLVV